MAEIANFSLNERDSYENSLKYYRDLNNVVDTSREEGLQEGLTRGREEGLQEGLARGREEEKLLSLQRQRSAVGSHFVITYYSTTIS